MCQLRHCVFLQEVKGQRWVCERCLDRKLPQEHSSCIMTLLFFSCPPVAPIYSSIHPSIQLFPPPCPPYFEPQRWIRTQQSGFCLNNPAEWGGCWLIMEQKINLSVTDGWFLVCLENCNTWLESLLGTGSPYWDLGGLQVLANQETLLMPM